ncbi:MAG TPA: nuclear transport factor 2 family protein [Solirubrobacteraceae bacterium]|nr:nuclear transport factor 2 family protein [Solirubrobacteraceae bacterium]
MSQENVKIVQRMLAEYFATGEPPEPAWFADELEVFDHDTPDQGAYRGYDGALRWLDEWGAAWTDWSIEPENFIDAGDSVVIFIRMKAEGRSTGIELDREDALVYGLRSLLITRIDYYNDRNEALKAVGLEE